MLAVSGNNRSAVDHGEDPIGCLVKPSTCKIRVADPHLLQTSATSTAKLDRHL